MNLDIDKDWFAKKAAEEGDLEIGAGMRKTLTVDLTPEEIALLERLIDPAKSDMRARIAALEAENEKLRKALEASRDVHAGLAEFILKRPNKASSGLTKEQAKGMFADLQRARLAADEALEAKP